MPLPCRAATRGGADSGRAQDEAGTYNSEIRLRGLRLRPVAITAATLAAGAALTALDAIGDGRARNGYALVRPPGHHATRDTAMGFCLFNNVAVAARYAQETLGLAQGAHRGL